jgi:hypothetical protein
MFHTCLYVALVAMICVVRRSGAADCASQTFTQGIDAIKMNASQIIAADYANSTKAQIVARLLELYNQSVVSIDYTVVQSGNSISINYSIIFACNVTTTTVLSDGTSQTNQSTSNVNTAQVANTITNGL